MSGLPCILKERPLIFLTPSPSRGRVRERVKRWSGADPALKPFNLS
jgi:hypothetical protein